MNKLVNRIKIGSPIDKQLYQELKELSLVTRVPISKLLDEAIEDLIEKKLNK